MSTAIEEQLRVQIETELTKKQEELRTAQAELSAAHGRVERANRAINSLHTEVDELETKLARFDEVFGTTKRKPAKKTATTKPAAVNNSRAAQGRREVASGARPKIRDAMRVVMGDQIMNAKQIYDLLSEKGWLPNSNDPLLYIKYLLSSLNDFERVEGRNRGLYRVVPATLGYPPGATPPGNGVPAAMLSETDEILRDAGVLPAN